MKDRDLYAQILGIRKPWFVTDVQLALPEGEILVRVELLSSARLSCPSCEGQAKRYDCRRRRWRHLDTCQYRTILEAEVPRVECAEHGVQQIPVPWAEPNSRFTALFEALVIDWLQEASLSAVARLLNLTWDQVNGVMERAVKRGLKRRQLEVPTRIGVDETSFQKRHEYVTSVIDLVEPKVLYVADDRKSESLSGFYEGLTEKQRARIKVVAMDMHRPYINATREHVPDADTKIAFDKFHVAQHLSNAVDDVRRQENRELLEAGDRTLVGTKYLWLKRKDVPPAETTRAGFMRMAKGLLRTARAWAIKEAAMLLWKYRVRGWAQRGWRSWISWAMRSRLEPIRKVARTIRDHLPGIINAIVARATNAATESINSRIQWLKKMACGFRNRERFRNAIYFHLGGLDLYPDACSLTHTNA
ncbi:MAG: ISL3 family transposase [Armatimonadetes bacterium]|nr:MAG: ISL3 family transposase [Armatimonadota bacterium]